MILSTVPAAVLSTIFVVSLAVAGYRLVLHPLAGVPGPKLAAVSTLSEIYYDLVRKGQLPWPLKRLYGRYGRYLVIYRLGTPPARGAREGPITHNGPNEVHISTTAALSSRSSRPSAASLTSMLHISSI